MYPLHPNGTTRKDVALFVLVVALGRSRNIHPIYFISSSYFVIDDGGDGAAAAAGHTGRAQAHLPPRPTAAGAASARPRGRPRPATARALGRPPPATRLPLARIIY